MEDFRMKKSLTGLAAALGLLCLAPVASASVISFDFKSDGTLAAGNCGILCYTVHTSGTAYDYTNDVPGTSSWAFNGHMTFFGTPLWGGTDDGSPTSWTFTDTGASGNNLSGTFSWNFPLDWSLDPVGTAHYDITGGSGLFAGATGTGSSVISITNWWSGLPKFSEYGTMRPKTSPTAVPEPGLMGLVGTGLMMMGFLAYRRRRVDVTRN
jgi:hypothetical protein